MAMVLAAVSGCAHPDVWFAGKYYGLPSDLVADQPAVAAPPSRVANYRVAPGHEAHVYRVENQKLNWVYQRLTARMALAPQLELSREQTAWLNRRAILCTEAGVFDDRCGTKLTSERIAVLEAREDASPRLPDAVPVTASRGVTPPAVHAATVPVKDAHALTYTVAATAMPWVWKPGGLNASFQYGLQDGSPPTVVALGPDAQAGQYVTIKYVAGQIALGAGGPKADGLGYAGQKDHGGKGITGQKLPSSFMRPYPINLGSLVGVFTDQRGGIVGAPFAIGDGAVSKQVPPGARQIQLGVNDDIYGGADAATGNSGSFTVAVSPGRS